MFNNPRPSMYGLATYIEVINGVNAGTVTVPYMGLGLFNIGRVFGGSCFV